jgi:hypothetical protein
MIELAAALSSAVSASLQVVLDTLPLAPLLAAFAGHLHWFNAVITGALFAAMVAALHFTDVAGVIRERRRVLRQKIHACRQAKRFAPGGRQSTEQRLPVAGHSKKNRLPPKRHGRLTKRISCSNPIAG